MDNSRPTFQLPNRIGRLLMTLSKIYMDRGDSQKRRLIVNSKATVQEDQERVFSESLERTIYGHTLHLDIPENLYPSDWEDRVALQDQIKNDISEAINIPDEYVSAVFLELEEREDRDWRLESGVLLPRKRSTTREAAERIWGSEGYRVFLSHKAEAKAEAAGLKERLAVFGVSAFVAHADIHPTKQWQEEIENALASMDAFLALLTKDFHESDWTDQEVGYALDRGVPLIAVKLGRDPYGFIGRFQALACKWDDASLRIVKLLIKQPRMLDCYIAALPKCRSFEEGNLLSKLLPDIEELDARRVELLIAASNGNTNVRESYGFSGEKPSVYGDGLVGHLARITGKTFMRDEEGKIEIKKE